MNVMNYSSAVNVLTKAGYRLTNKCTYDGQTYHDFGTRKDTTVSLVVDQETGAVVRAEVSKMKWSDKSRRYEMHKDFIFSLQELVDRFAPRKPMSL